MKPLTAEELRALPPGTRGWMVIDKNDLKNSVQFPMDLEYHMAVFAFLRKEDAEHMKRLLDKYAEELKKEWDVADDLLWDLIEGSNESKTPLCVLDEANALDYFTRYINMLDAYYSR